MLISRAKNLYTVYNHRTQWKYVWFCQPTNMTWSLSLVKLKRYFDANAVEYRTRFHNSSKALVDGSPRSDESPRECG